MIIHLLNPQYLIQRVQFNSDAISLKLTNLYKNRKQNCQIISYL